MSPNDDKKSNTPSPFIEFSLSSGWPKLPETLPGITADNMKASQPPCRQPVRPTPLKNAYGYLTTNAGMDRKT